MNTLTTQNIFLERLILLNWKLIFLAVILSVMGIINVHSATEGAKTITSIIHLGLGLSVMFVIALSPSKIIMRSALPIFLLGVLLLILVPFFGVSAKGAKRWLDFGFIRFQPSEIMKIAVPLVLAWVIHHLLERSNWIHIPFTLAILALPTILIVMQPDLGTSLLIITSGLAVLFLAGLPWKLIIGGVILFVSYAPLHWFYFMKDYQKQRVLTLFDPYSDPLGKGYHSIQSIIAVGSGGVLGKGYGQGTQTQLNFLPEPHTDFAFAVFAEEWGYVGFMVLIALFALLIFSSLQISLRAYTKFGRLLAGSLAITLFVYFFINMGMVVGILPIVGVPLPFISYGGTSAIITFATIGLILSCDRQPRSDVLIKPIM